MVRVGIWESDGGLWPAVRQGIKGLAKQPEFRVGSHPAELAGARLDLLVVSPGAAGWAGASVIDCRVALLPGAAGPLARQIKAESAVSYGTAPKDTLTLSSLEGGQICLALQRELVTIQGAVVERQELVLPYPAGEESPERFMAKVGTLLLLGVAVE